MKQLSPSTYEALCCVGWGYKPSNDHQWGPGIRDLYAMHYVISGSGFYWMNRTCYEVHEGESFLIFPQTEVYYYADSKDPWEYVWLEFRGDEGKELINLTALSPCTPVTAAVEPSLRQYWKELFHIPEANSIRRFEEERSSAKLRLLLSYYLEYFPRSQSTVSTDYVLAAKQFIKANYWKSDLSVREVVQHVNIDRTYLFRLFKENTGSSVYQYLTLYRLQKACELLMNSSIDIKTTAYSVGYSDQLNFSKIFKRMIKKTPSQYRMEWQDSSTSVR